MPKQPFPAAAEGVPFDDYFAGQLEKIETRARALRCMARLASGEVDGALFPGTRMTCDSFYVAPDHRDTIGFCMATVVEQAVMLEKEFVALADEWRADWRERP